MRMSAELKPKKKKRCSRQNQEGRDQAIDPEPEARSD